MAPASKNDNDDSGDEEDFVDAEEGSAQETDARPAKDEDVSDESAYDTALRSWPKDPAEAQALIRQLESSLDKDLHDVKHAVDLFLNSRFQEAEDFLRPKFGMNLYYTLGTSCLTFLKAALTWDPMDVAQASEALKTSIALSNRLRKRSNAISNVLSSVHNFVRPGEGLAFNEMTPLQKHAELVHAEAYLLKAILSLVTDSNLVAFVREGISIRNSYGVYRSAWSHVVNTPPENMDVHFNTGVLLGIGDFNVILSFLPPKILRLFEVIGFTGDQEFGLKCIEIGAGWDLPPRLLYGSYKKRKGSTRVVSVGSQSSAKGADSAGAEEEEGKTGSPVWNGRSLSQSPTSPKSKTKGKLTVLKGAIASAVKSSRSSPTSVSPTKVAIDEDANDFPISTPQQGIRSFLCGLSLAGFHGIVSQVIPIANGDPDLANFILERCLADYPNSTYHRLIHARHTSTYTGDPVNAAKNYQALLSTHMQWRTLQHLVCWDLAHLYAVMHEWDKAAELYGVLLKESRWSPATYAYAKGACLAMTGNSSEARELFYSVEGKMQRIAGKRIPLEKFVARKTRKFKMQKDALMLPALELFYMFGYFGIASSESILKTLSVINAEIAKLKLEAGPTLWTTIEQLGMDARILVHDTEDEDELSEELVSKDGKPTTPRENWWDDLVLLLFLRGVARRELSLPTRHFTKPVTPTTILTSAIPSTEFPPPKATPNTPSSVVLPASSTIPDALSDFATIVSVAHLIRWDHYVLPFARYELGNLYFFLGYYSRARTQFELSKVGGYAERDAKKRGWKTGKYGDGTKHSNDTWISLRLHNVVEKLDVAERVKGAIIAREM
ncbi:hypothetical protein M427DRAFT_157049 [Gonapodya prolifera JEL478]|uniref:Uncharacterized protein n=1 Tax=Gonapodya prolifera (strain JEL478) TaxID=1344416 RepID=A0A139A805_GONPJ|nr:hypothetical protein M427DRAFT_157049 [Gonapodya prolifera JEL478]|eukprot:KXS12829.1 hypothetical protein M427DRAFT_157049 [Gonapodya prolifera JEL478]